MPITGHRVLRDDPLEHIAHVDYRPPCVAQTLAPTTANANWTWQVRFAESGGDGGTEVLMIRVSHRIAPHGAEPAPNAVGPVVYLNPCRRASGGPILTPDAHGTHEDRLFTYIRRSWFWPFTRYRLYILVQHLGGDAAIDVPRIPGDGRGSLNGLVARG
jgi:hypothetical protein